MRQFCMIRKKAGEEPERLNPDSQTYKDSIGVSPSIQAAIEFVRSNQHTELLGLRMGDTFYSIVVLERNSLQPEHVPL